MRSVGEQVIVGTTADNLGQALADLALEKAHDLAHALQGESLAPQFANDGDFGQMIHRIEAPMPFPRRLDHATLVPPLQLSWSDSRQRDHLLRCKAILHLAPSRPETITVQNVSNILGMSACGSSRESGMRGD